MKYSIFNLLFFIICALLAAVPNAYAQEGRLVERPPVLVELFTAENCPACPPADAYFEQLAGAQSVLPLACHITYFGKGQGGLERPFCTKRQKAYTGWQGRQKYFTPEMIVNGHTSLVGHQTEKVAAALLNAQNDGVASITVSPRTNGVYTIAVPAPSGGAAHNLWLVTYQKRQDVLTRGGMKTYVNIAENFLPLGPMTGAPVETRTVYPPFTAQSAGLIVAAQDQQTGAIRALGHYPL